MVLQMIMPSCRNDYTKNCFGIDLCKLSLSDLRVVYPRYFRQAKPMIDTGLELTTLKWLIC